MQRFCLHVFDFSITGVVFGLAPAIQSTTPDLTAALRRQETKLTDLDLLEKSARDWSGRGFDGAIDWSWTDRRGLQQAQSTDLGFESKNLLVLSMDLAPLS